MQFWICKPTEPDSKNKSCNFGCLLSDQNKNPAVLDFGCLPKRHIPTFWISVGYQNLASRHLGFRLFPKISNPRQLDLECFGFGHVWNPSRRIASSPMRKGGDGVYRYAPTSCTSLNIGVQSVVIFFSAGRWRLQHEILIQGIPTGSYRTCVASSCSESANGQYACRERCLQWFGSLPKQMCRRSIKKLFRKKNKKNDLFL